MSRKERGLKRARGSGELKVRKGERVILSSCLVIIIAAASARGKLPLGATCRRRLGRATNLNDTEPKYNVKGL